MIKLFLTITLFALSISDILPQDRALLPEEQKRNTGAPFFAHLPDSLSPLNDVIVYVNSEPERADRMMEGSRMINDFDNTMKYALMMLDIAKKAEDQSQMGRAYMFMGKTQYRAGDKSEALKYFDLAEQYFTAGRDAQALSQFYLTLANIYIEYAENEKSYRYALLYEQSLEKLAESDYDNELFIEIHKGRAYIMLAEILFNLGRGNEAAVYYEKFRGTWNATDPDEGLFIVPYLMSAERYSEAEPYVLRNEAYMRQSGDTINDNMLNVKRFLQYINYNLGNIEKSYDYLQQRNIITNYLRRRENRSSAIEIAAIYETAEREATITAQKEELRVRKMYAMTAAIVSTLLLALLIVIIFFNRKLSRKNKRLVESIQQQLSAKKKSALLPDFTTDHTAQPETKGNKPGHQLFEKTDRLMHTERLYLNKGLLRDDVVNLLGTNKNYLIEAIQTFRGMTFTDYVNSLRLEHSLGLLSGTDEIISAVADKSGFGSVSTYHRLFTEKYGISPNTYRRLLKKDKTTHKKSDKT